MFQFFLGIILLIFFGLFVAMMAFPMKDEVAKLNQKSQTK